MRPLLLALLALLPLSALGAPTLTGRVLDDSGKPLSNAHVYVYTALPKTGLNTICPSCYRDCGKRDTVNAKGEFTIAELDAALRFRVLAVADGYEPAFSEYVDPVSGPVVFKLKARPAKDAGQLVCGRVVDPNGKAVVGAVVAFHAIHLPGSSGYGAIPGNDPLSITGSAGEFALRISEPQAKFDLRVRAANFAPEISTQHAPGQDRIITVDIGAAISGRLVRDGKPAPSTPIRIVQTNRASKTYLGEETIATDDEGRFIVTGLGPNEQYGIYLGASLKEPVKVVKVAADGTSVEAGEIAVGAR